MKLTRAHEGSRVLFRSTALCGLITLKLFHTQQLFDGMPKHHRKQDATCEQEQQVQEPSTTLYRAISSDINGPLHWIPLAIGTMNMDEVSLTPCRHRLDRHGTTQNMGLQFAVFKGGKRGASLRWDEPNRHRLRRSRLLRTQAECSRHRHRHGPPNSPWFHRRSQHRLSERYC